MDDENYISDEESPGLEVRLQYGGDGNRDITHEPYAERDATSATWYTVDGTVFLSAQQTSRGRWKITTSDIVVLAVSHYDIRHHSPDAAYSWAVNRIGGGVREVNDW